MKILCIDFDNPYGPTPGGQFQDTQQMIFPLHKEHEILVLTAGPVPQKQTLPVKYLGLPLGIGRQFDFIRQARQYVATHSDFDLIIEQFTSPIGPIGLPRLTSKPVIAIGSFLFWTEMSGKYHLPFQYIANNLLQQYRYLFCYDQNQAALCQAINPRLTIYIRKPSVQTAGSSESKRSNTILFIGRPDTHQKGLDLLTTILNQINIPDGKIVIAGGATALKGYVGALPITFTGYLNDHQKAQIYKETKILVMPSRYESFGFVQLEAATYGVPTVAFDLPVFKERRAAMRLVEPFSTASFRKAIEELCQNDNEYQKLSQANRLLAKQYTTKSADLLRQTIAEIVKDPLPKK